VGWPDASGEKKKRAYWLPGVSPPVNERGGKNGGRKKVKATYAEIYDTGGEEKRETSRTYNCSNYKRKSQRSRGERCITKSSFRKKKDRFSAERGGKKEEVRPSKTKKKKKKKQQKKPIRQTSSS